jgi:hypothetical protein
MNIQNILKIMINLVILHKWSAPRFGIVGRILHISAVAQYCGGRELRCKEYSSWVVGRGDCVFPMGNGRISGTDAVSCPCRTNGCAAGILINVVFSNGA